VPDGPPHVAVKTALRDTAGAVQFTAHKGKAKDTEAEMHGTHYWVVGGEFRSLNFHQLVHGTAQVEGPFPSRKEAENAWRTLSEKNRHRCNVRFSIVEEPRKAMV
jgi:hypothetical protein